MESDSIKLIIKSTNKLFEDQIITCKLNWDINQLKNHLSMVCPNQPEPKGQKLIYSGQFLDNSLQLKNIFLNHLSNKVFTVHLIYNVDFDQNSKTENQYLAIKNSEGQNCRKVQDLYTLESISSASFFNYECGQLNDRQIAWIQQVYKHYLFNYMDLISMQESQILDINLYNQFLGFDNINNIIVNGFRNTENVRQLLNQSDYANNNNDNNYNNNIDNDMNINDGREDIDPGNNRDWLDNFYILSRLIILFSIVYFYASPIRFLIVGFLGLLIYLYHNRFFRNIQFHQENNNRDGENNNQFIQNQNRFHIVQRRIQNLSENESEVPDRINHNNDNHQERPGALLFVWIFFSSFFSSMVPEQPNAA